MHVTWLPAAISVVATLSNIGLNFVFIRYWQATGLAISTTLTIGFLQLILLVVFLYTYFGISISGKHMIEFLGRYSLQLLLILVPLYGIYCAIHYAAAAHSSPFTNFFIYGLGFWIWVGPLCIVAALLVYFTRKRFKVHLFFID